MSVQIRLFSAFVDPGLIIALCVVALIGSVALVVVLAQLLKAAVFKIFQHNGDVL